MAWNSWFFNLTSKPIASVSEPKEPIELLLYEINRYRTNSHLKPCVLDPKLCEQAQTHSVAQTKMKQCTHFGILGDNPLNRTFSAGYANPAIVCENVAEGFATAKAVMCSWCCSANHREILLNPLCTAVGLGMEFNGSLRYWTAIFVAPMDCKNNDIVMRLSGPVHRITKKHWHHLPT